jgi:membrane-associated phospholipid phosphatase
MSVIWANELVGGRLAELQRLDGAVYQAVVRTDTPGLDGAMRRLSQSADYSKLSVAAAAMLAVAGGERGRRAAASGLAMDGLTSMVVNLGMKPLGRRHRPARDMHRVVLSRRVPMPASASFPSGHSACAFAFAAGAGRVLPAAGVMLRALATVVSYSRVHTGVHYPGDVIAGALIGSVIADLSADAVDGRLSHIWTKLSSRSS